MRLSNSLRVVRTTRSTTQPTRCFSTRPSPERQPNKADPRETLRAVPTDQPSARMEPGDGQASLVQGEQKASAPVETYHPRHQPDYRAHVDHGTSLYSPVPRRVQDGSEPGETLPAAVLSGAPLDMQARVARIYKPIKPATQSGTWGSSAWRMDWDPLPKGHRWENPLMGWASSADAMQGTNIKFKSKEAAVAFAEKQGYEYYVQEPNERRFVPKAYANNFLHEPGPLKHIKTK